MGGCCYSCLRYMVMVFNLLYMIMGIGILGLSVWMFVDGSRYVPIGDIEGYNYVLYFLIAVGAVMTIMGFLGCCGALQESQCMLATFFALVLVLLAGQVAAGVWICSNENRFREVLKKYVAQSIQHDYGTNEVKTQAFNVLQKSLQCCGSNGPSDWAESRYNNADSKSKFEIGITSIAGIYKVPESCCSVDEKSVCEAARQLSLTGSLSGTIYTKGCSEKILELMKGHEIEFYAVLGAVGLVELLAMIFSILLCCAVRRIDQFKA